MVIATRVLKFSKSGIDVDVPIRLFAPQAGEDAWSCRYEIDWPDDRRRMVVWGADSVQAIVLALQMIGADIYTSSYHKSGKLMHEAPGRGYGFPVPSSIRDLREGGDAVYDA